MLIGFQYSLWSCWTWIITVHAVGQVEILGSEAHQNLKIKAAYEVQSDCHIGGKSWERDVGGGGTSVAPSTHNMDVMLRHNKQWDRSTLLTTYLL